MNGDDNKKKSEKSETMLQSHMYHNLNAVTVTLSHSSPPVVSLSPLLAVPPS
jgi:hypothetical protein